MHIISRRKLREFWMENKNSETALDNWFRQLKNIAPKNLVELQATFKKAESVGTCTVFNVGGNKYRLIAYINYTAQKVYILHVLTHAEYDTNKWKKDCDC